MAKTLLIAEDHIPLQKSLRDWLLSAFPDCEVLTADDGVAAVEIACRHSPSLAIMDLNLPKMNGIEATRLLRQAYPEMPIIVLTMYEGEPYQSESLDAGATVFLTKRLMQTDLLPVLKRLFAEIKDLSPVTSASAAKEKEKAMSEDLSDPGSRDINTEGPLRILLVEDNPGDARLIREMLRESSTETFLSCEAESIQTALACLKKENIDMILTDLHLPDSDGIETIQSLNRQAPSLPIIVLTGQDDEALADQSIRGGAQDYLRKNELSPYLLNRSLRLARERKRIEEALREGDETIKALLNATADAAYFIDLDGTYLAMNNAGAERHGKTVSELIGCNAFALVPGENVRKRKSCVEEAIRTERPVYLEEEREGRYLESVVYPIIGAYGRVFRLAIFSRDVTEQKKLRDAFYETERRFRDLFEHVQMVTVMLDTEGYVSFCNPYFLKLAKRRSEEVIGHNWFDLCLPQEIGPAMKERYVKEIQTGNVTLHYENPIRSGLNDQRVISWTNTIIRDKQGRISGTMSIGEDITERRATEERIRYLAYYDTLTGLPNRALFSDRTAQAIAAARRHGTKLALLMLDLDRFKDVNDELGHRAGDQMLIGVSERLRQCLRATDTVARFGGDEFVILLPEVQGEEGVRATAAKILESLQSPLLVEGRCLTITASIGAAIYPGHGIDEDSLLKHADKAMYSVKEKGRNAYEIYSV